MTCENCSACGLASGLDQHSAEIYAMSLTRLLQLHRCLASAGSSSMSCNTFQGLQQLRAASTSSAESALQPRNFWCVGRNYEDHIKELGNQNSAPKENPMIFLKAGTSMVPHTHPSIILPGWSKDVHHEVELAIELGPDLAPVRGAVALDLTARDVQSKLKAKQWPWTLAKSFPHSTPVGTPFILDAGLDIQKLELHLMVNDKTRQRGSTAAMIFPIHTLIDYVKAHFPVAPGDMILTGTPAGVSAMKAGDKVVAQVLSSSGEVLSQGAWSVVTQ